MGQNTLELSAEADRFVETEVLEYDLDIGAPPALVLDLGAHCGAYTAFVHRQFPEARVVACEPHPENAACYRRNFSSNQFALLEAAARDFEGTADLRVGKNTATHSFHDLGAQNGGKISVRCLDAQTLPAADLIKIDTEGCELEILQRLDLSQARGLVVEYHTLDDERALRNFCSSKKFLLHEKITAGGPSGVLKYVRRVNPDRLFIGVPMYAAPNPFFAQALIHVLSNPPVNVLYRQSVGDSPVGRSRNILTYEFLESDCSHLLFIDCDLIFSKDHILRLLSHKEELVGGLYPKKQPKLEWVVNTLPDPQNVLGTNGLWNVRYVGTGFMRVARTVFEQMIARWGDEIRYTADNGLNRTEYNLWPIGPYQYPDGYRRYLSEDWFFCQRWLDLGGQVWADTRVLLKHCGQAVYPLESPYLSAPTESGAGAAPSCAGSTSSTPHA